MRVIETDEAQELGHEVSVATRRIAEQIGDQVKAANATEEIETAAAKVPEVVQDELQEMVGEAYARFGQLDALVANAGIGAYGGIMDLTDEQLAAMMDINVAGTVWPILAAVPGFLEAGGGDIVIVASVAGLRGAGDEAVYAATKFAQVGLL